MIWIYRPLDNLFCTSLTNSNLLACLLPTLTTKSIIPPLLFTYQRLCVHHLSCDSLSNHVDRPFVIILFMYLILLKRWFWTVGIGPWPCTPKEETVPSRFFLARLKEKTKAVEWCLIVSTSTSAIIKMLKTSNNNNNSISNNNYNRRP